MKRQLKAFCSWSGGKDSALALYRALNGQEHGLDVTHCLNMMNEDGTYSRSHGIRPGILEEQVNTMGMKLVQQPATWDNYEVKFKEAVAVMKQEGVEAGVFGDIDLEPHREWVERVCGEMGIKAFLPLWQGKREDLMDEFLDAGFKAIITATNSVIMGEEWLGRWIDRQLIDDINKRGDIDLCGEKGEYHTLVTDGPLFSKRITINTTEPVKIGNHWFLNITGYGTAAKQRG